MAGLEMKVLQGRLIARARGNVVAWHLNGAKRFSERCAEIEAEYAATRVLDGEGLCHHCLASVMLSVAAIDSFVNELFHDLSVPANQAPQLRKLWEEVELRAIWKRYAGWLAFRNLAPLDEKDPAYLEANALISARNALVHHWPEWRDAKDQHFVMASTLAGKFSVTPTPCASPPIFPDDYMSAGCAVWAWTSAVDFLEWFVKRAGIDRRFR